VTTQQLRQWIDALPAESPIRVAFNAGNDSGAAALANAKTVAGTRFVPIGEFSQWLTVTGIRFKFRNAEREESTSEDVQNFIDVVFGLERNPHVTVVDPSAAGSILNGLLAGGVVSQTDATSFNTLVSSLISPIEDEFGPTKTTITPDDLGQARKVVI
jgi:hypothetical protein